MVENSDLIIFLAVVLARFLVPLAIPKYPLPAVITALIIDGIDQTIFQKYTTLNLDGYQGYDKALDIYYLTITYISTLRNWTNLYAFKVGRFLWYYRLIGITLFELTYSGEGPRWLLLIFPNTFEYFFIFIESIRLRWNMDRLNKKFILLSAAFIWIFIKLPQEYWIHIAQLDATDFIKEEIFGVPTDATISEMLNAAPWFIPLVLAITVILVFLGKYIYKRLPSPDWNWRFSNNLESSHNQAHAIYSNSEDIKFTKKLIHIFNSELFEKMALISLVTVIFAQILPNVNATNMQVVVGVSYVVLVNSLISSWLSKRGTEWKSMFIEFVVMSIVNLFVVLFFSLILSGSDGSINIGNTMFFILLITLIITLFDKYKGVHDERFGLHLGS